MKRFKLFLGAIWQDVGMSRQELLMVTITIMVLIPIVLGPIIGLAYLLSWLTGKAINDGAIEASVGIFMILFGMLLFISYIKKKWRETKQIQTSKADP